MSQSIQPVPVGRVVDVIPLEYSEMLFGDQTIRAYKAATKGFLRLPKSLRPHFKAESTPHRSFLSDMGQALLEVCGAPGQSQGEQFWEAFECAARVQLISLPRQRDREKVAALATRGLRSSMRVAAPRAVRVGDYNIALSATEGYVGHTKTPVQPVLLIAPRV